MAKKDVADMSVEQKLKNLYQLQTTLSEVDRIKTLRGELPTPRAGFVRIVPHSF